MDGFVVPWILRSRRVVTGDRIGPADVRLSGPVVVDVRITSADDRVQVPPPDPTEVVVDVGELTVAPGLIDTQINGAGPVDLRRDPAQLRSLCAVAARHGVTTLVATLPSHDLDRGLVDALRDEVATMHRADAPVAGVAGLHLEGPFLAPGRAGAHRRDDLRPVAVDIVQGWARDPFVAMVTLAPELDGAIEAIEMLTASGTVAAMGHTDAELGDVHAAVEAGARHVTHLWNAMAGLHHRRPGVIGAALTDDRVTAGLICDGVHVDPVVVALTWSAMGPARLVLVSDAVASAETTGADPTPAAVVGPCGTLQGSTTMLDQGLRNLLASTGASPADALATVTTNPARLLRRSDIGVLERGARADLVILDDDLVPVHVLIGGRWVPDLGAPGC